MIMCALLIISTFLPQIYAPYLALGFAFLYILISRKKLKGKTWFNFLLAFLIFGTISYGYNFFFVEESDAWGLLLWSGTFLFPFLVMIVFSTFRQEVRINYLMNFYFGILLFEFILIAIQALSTGTFYLQDDAKGTCRDAHILGLHFALGIIILSNIIIFDKSVSPHSKKRYILYLLIFTIGQIMTSFVSQWLFLIITLTLFYLIEFVIKNRRIIHLIVLASAFVIIAFISPNTRFSNIPTILESRNDIVTTKYGAKLYSYQLLITEIPKYVNLITGTGPGTYTSRAAQIRIPEIATLRFPLEIPDYRSWAFNRFIYPIYFTGSRNLLKFSYGTSASPMTTVISVCVELGVIGAIIFILFFYVLFKKSKLGLCEAIKRRDYHTIAYLKGRQYVLIFFILTLFYLNFWEYPELTIPVLGLMCCLTRDRRRLL